MGKSSSSKKGRDADKKAALQAKKEAKAEKAAVKRLRKEQHQPQNSGTIEENDHDGGSPTTTRTATTVSPLDALLQHYRQIDQVESPKVESMDGFPLPRANATLTWYDQDDLTASMSSKKKAQQSQLLYLFGGEYYDGVEHVVLNQLLQYNVAKKEWKRILSPIAPPPRCAHSCVYYQHALYVFGGERATADDYYHYKDLWKFDLITNTWHEIKVPKVGTIPTARSGHAAVVWNHYMIVFGGFFEAAPTKQRNQAPPRWFNDVTVLDLQTLTWLDIPHSKLTARPEPRSACNVVLIHDDRILVHGGFSKLSAKQTAVSSSSSSSSLSRPTDPIGGMEAAVASPETKVHTDAWILHLKPLFQHKPPTWERLTSSVQRRNHSVTASKNPNGRAGTSAVALVQPTTKKSQMLVFGGVVDKELHHHMLDSAFYNDLHALDVERRKWLPIQVNMKSQLSKKSGESRNPQKSAENEEGDEGNKLTETKIAPASDDENKDNKSKIDAEEEVEDDDGDNNDDEDEEEDENEENEPANKGWDLDKLRSNMFAFLDGEGNLVCEKIDDRAAVKEKEEDDEEEKEEEKDDDASQPEREETKEDKPKAFKKKTEFHPKITASTVMALNPDTQRPESVERPEPLPRIKPCLVVIGQTLYLYGGLLEVGDREVTLDDFWSLDLKKRDCWHCIYAGSMHQQVWRGVTNDDEDSYYSSKAGDDNRDEEKLEDGDDDDDDDDDALSDREDDGEEDAQEKQQPIAADRLGDEQDTPQTGESLADFYARTSVHWNQLAASLFAAANQAAESGHDEKGPDEQEQTQLSNKELKREGFILARKRFEEVVGPETREQHGLSSKEKETASSDRKDRKKSDDKKKSKKAAKNRG